MKKNFYLIAAFALLAVGLSSCQLDKDPVDYSKFYANALVTVKHNADNVFYLQLDDKTTVKPDNMEKSPFGDKQVRALANLTIKDDVKPEGDFDKTVTINWIDSVRTKDIVPSLGDLDDKEYGTDPIEIIGNWVTIVEDGYLTLSFCALWGNPSVAHSINLVSGVDPKNPYVLELRHNAMGDNYHINPTYGNGVIAFDLSSLPSTEGKEVDLVINYKGLNISNASVKFKYCTGEAAQTGRQPSFEKLTKSLEIK